MTHDERRARAFLASIIEAPEVQLLDIMRAIRQSDDAAGFVLVPREPTPEMLTEGAWDISPWHEAYNTEEGRRAAIRDVWIAMLAATGNDDAE